MALLPSESPAITIREVDLSGIVPAITSSTGSYSGAFNWGPQEKAVLVGNEAELASAFGSPSLTDLSSVDFLSAAQFLKYSGSLQINRVSATGDLNAVDSSAGGTLVKNLDDWNDKVSTLNTGVSAKRFVAKYAGSAGNSLAVSICPWSGLSSEGGGAAFADSAFDNWAYKSYFDAAPGTSDYVAARSADSSTAHDEIHVVVLDEDGQLTGTPGTVLETFPFLSHATDAKTEDGSTNFVIDALNNRSSYIWAATLGESRSITTTSASFTNSTLQGVAQDAYTGSFSSGVNGSAAKQDYIDGFDVFKDPDTIQVDFLIAPGLAATGDQKDVVDALVTIAKDRKDCVVVTSPHRDGVVDVLNAATITTNVTTGFADTLPSSSYLVIDNNYLKVYDKYKDQYSFIPSASSTAGIMAATDNVAAPWFSPAGNRRGQYFGASSLAYSPTKSQRDTLYKSGVNPIVNFPGQGILLFGDKTHLTRPSAFDRINVRRLFLVMERAIKAAAQNVMFEFNDEFTRAEFVNIVEPFLREIKGRRGISDFRVVCDDTNNTPQIIDTNQFVADIYVKPARSINYVTLSFVAVRTGVDFEEVVGLA